MASFRPSGASCFFGPLVKVPVCWHDDTLVWWKRCPAENNPQCFRAQNKWQIQTMFSGCHQRFEKAPSSSASVLMDLTLSVLGVCSHDFMQTRVTEFSEVGVPRKQVGGGEGWGRSCHLISSHSRSHWRQQQRKKEKNKKRETKVSISSDPSVSCHAEIGRATYVK